MRRALFLLSFLLPVAAGLLCAPLSAVAQGNYSLSLTSTYDNNSFSLYDRRADVYHQISAGASHDFAGDYANLTLYYYGAIVLFRTYDSRTYNLHTLGGWYQLQLDHRDGEDAAGEEETQDRDEEEAGDEDTTGNAAERKPIPEPVKIAAAPVDRNTPAEDSLVTYLHMRPTVSARFDKQEFNFYDHKSAGVNILIRRHLAGAIIGRIMAETNYKEYPNFRQFSHLENLARLSVSGTAGAGREIFGSAEFGYKSYLNTVTATTILTRGSGKGKGGMMKDTIVTTYSTPGTGQAVISAGLVQSFGTDRTLALSYVRRLNPRNQARAAAGDLPIGTSEDEIFDDRYGYQSHEALLVLRMPVPLGLSLEGEALVHRKVYPQEAVNLAGQALPGNPQRFDLRFGVSLQLSRPLARKKDGSAALTLGVAYAYTRNMSNNETHDYHIHQAGLTLAAEF